MHTVSAKDAKYNFGELIDKARAAPVTVAKYGRPVVVVMAVEEYERLTGMAEAPENSGARGATGQSRHVPVKGKVK